MEPIDQSPTNVIRVSTVWFQMDIFHPTLTPAPSEGRDAGRQESRREENVWSDWQQKDNPWDPEKEGRELSSPTIPLAQMQW